MEASYQADFRGESLVSLTPIVECKMLHTVQEALENIPATLQRLYVEKIWVSSYSK